MLEIVKLSTGLNANKILANQINQLIRKTLDLRKIKPRDHEKVSAFKNELTAIQAHTLKFLHFNLEQFSIISSIFQLYPALVIPIELREDSAVVRESLTSIKKHDHQYA